MVNKEDLKQRYRDEFGEWPTCDCGCGQDVDLTSRGKPRKRIEGHAGGRPPNIPPDAWKRSDFRELVDRVRKELGLSIQDLSNITGMSRGFLNSRLFNKGKWVTVETVDEFLRPFAFGYYFLPIDRMSPLDGALKKWENPSGMIEFDSLRSEMLALKQELDTSWNRLADYWDMSPQVFRVYWTKETHAWIHEENAKLWRKRIRQVRSLPKSTKAEYFTPLSKSGNPQAHLFVDGKRIVDLLWKAKGNGTWNELAENLDVGYYRIRNIICPRYTNIRLSNYEDMLWRLREFLRQEEQRQNSVNAIIEDTYINSPDSNFFANKTKKLRESRKRYDAKKKQRRLDERLQREEETAVAS